MDGCLKNGEACLKLLDLIPRERGWHVKREEKERGHGFSEGKTLELRLGPPGGDWPIEESIITNKQKNESLLSLGYTSSQDRNPQIVGPALNSPWSSSPLSYNQQQTPFLQFPLTTTQQSLPVSQPFCTKGDLQPAEKKAFSPAPANTAVPNSSQKRTAPGPVVGWPPIRSFRKNLASTSVSKAPPGSQNGVQNKVAGEKPLETARKGMFVKINMDGVPIGRKVDLIAYDSYEKLSAAVDELFSGLLAAQRDSSAGGIMNKQEEEKSITGVLDGSGEYTLVYEDIEGDRMLVGDVPWHMFVSTVKRLRVLKSFELSALSLGNTKQDKISST
ncbi:AUX_IAA domain-containing protein [Cephalotus follicularis]|uniref:Auxin-responsive protein n=1 Tax=Cephalotus follicularis TaxID=3775 RepID=A0A1Q3B0C0_CEPFO|nr:AUX_IAA domain-containing protein [Cephalotus follicularis]